MGVYTFVHIAQCRSEDRGFWGGLEESSFIASKARKLISNPISKRCDFVLNFFAINY